MTGNYAYESQPVFIVGPVRSGSTLLRLMLDSHPGVINPGEFDFLFDLMTDAGDFPDLPGYEDWLRNNRIFRSTGLNIEKAASYPALIHSFIRQLEENGKILTINIHRHFQLIPILFPDARYIHLLRDPRDVARSCIGMGWVGHVYYGVDTWLEAEHSWDQLKTSLRREQYLEIKYEDILDDLTNRLSEICNFLGVSYSPAMLEYAKTSTYSMPDKTLSYQWKRKYSKRELQLVEGKVAEMIVDRKYDLSGYPALTPSRLELVKLFLINKSYRVRHGIRTYGLILYLEWFLSRRIGFKRWQDHVQRKIDRIDTDNLK